MKFIVTSEDAAQRLDVFLVSQLPALSRSRIKALMDEGRVQVDGSARKASHHVETGEAVTIEFPDELAPGVEPESIPLDVLYEDEDVAVVNKPAGMIVHPGAGVTSGTMVAALLHRFGGVAGLSSIGGPLRPGIVHRLDKETSGAIVIARTDDVHRKLVEDFRDRLVAKTYVALLHGKIKGDAGTIALPVARDLRRRSRMTARRREGRADLRRVAVAAKAARLARTGARVCASMELSWSKRICTPAARIRFASIFPLSDVPWWATRFTERHDRSA